MADYNCNCPPEYPNGISSPIPPFWGFSAFTPTIPKLYWDVKSQEQRILNLFDLLNKLVCYCDNMGLQIDVNANQIQKLKDEFETFKESGFFSYYAAQIEKWIQDNMEHVISQAIKMVFFGLTQDGYFCAYIPKSWAGILFDTVADYANENYGCLVLKY